MQLIASILLGFFALLAAIVLVGGLLQGWAELGGDEEDED